MYYSFGGGGILLVVLCVVVKVSSSLKERLFVVDECSLLLFLVTIFFRGFFVFHF